ncbi:MAG TPA: alpha/beta fold hydrolase [Caulobacteraceae bacterium]|nr:alpha/beta fold hydrolase [Caulobacteraceae bacterium]
MAELAADIRGEGAPALVLLHGFGATRAVWAGMLAQAERWPGKIVAPDLRGHGASPWGLGYGLGDHAACVAELLLAQGIERDFVVLGHSMGGAIGLALASGWFGVAPAWVLALGVKVVWTEAELERMAALASQPARFFETEADAVERFLKVSGLFGLIDPASPEARSGVVAENGAWRLACDPAAAKVGAPPMDALKAAARVPFRLAAGERDPMSRLDDLRRWDPDAAILPGLGHNAMVEDPAAVWSWLRAEAAL